MKTIQSLQATIDKDREKAASLRDQAGKQRLKADGYPDDPTTSQRYHDEAQRFEAEAIALDRDIVSAEAELTTLETQLADLERKKNDLIATKQAEIDRLETEAQTIRGDIHPFF